MRYKRKKSRRSVKCTMCTKFRWLGNSKSGKSFNELRVDLQYKEQMKGVYAQTY